MGKVASWMNGDSGHSLLVLLTLFLAAIVAVNQIILNDIASAAAGSGQSAQLSSGAPASANAAPSGNVVSANSVIPKGVPAIYGSELGVSFDDVSASNPKLADQTIAKLSASEGITLSGENMQRYINIASNISCEYCCGANAIIFPNGNAACGCAHSYAMRGLAKYLLQNHAGEYTDEEILEELGKWKTLFFPGKLIAKAQVLSQKGIELNYINLASNKYRGIEQGATASGGMVGGC